VEVTKVWIDENPQFHAQNMADATWTCNNVSLDGGPDNGNVAGNLQFFGNPGSDSFFVYPDWETGTDCEINEVSVGDSGVEIDDSNCDAILLFPGVPGSCTIFNTRLFEGIPTLGRHSLAILVLLMLGVGLIAFRRLA
jgi:hypothetical protein